MTLFRHKGNGLLYTIEVRYRGRTHYAIPYKHNVEVGIVQKSRFREFKANMSMDDFEKVAVA